MLVNYVYYATKILKLQKVIRFEKGESIYINVRI